MLHLTDDEIETLVQPDVAEQAVWAAFAAWGRGEVATTHRLRAIAPAGTVSAMAAVVPPYSGGKLYATKDGRFTFLNVLFDADGALVARAEAAGLPVTVHEEPGAAVTGAQVIVTVTNAREPLFPADALGHDTLVCAVGSTKHDRAELGPDVVECCGAVVCDDVEGSIIECGDLIQAAAAGRFDWSSAVELHAVAAGNVHVPRAGSAPVLFETQGVALQDVAAAALAVERHTAVSTTSQSSSTATSPAPRLEEAKHP